MEDDKAIIIKTLEDLQLHGRLNSRFKNGTTSCNLYIFAQKDRLIDKKVFPNALLSLWKEGKIKIDHILYDDPAFEEINTQEVVDEYREIIEGNFDKNNYFSYHISI